MQLTRQLVEQDHVFAVFNTVGTDNNLAIRDYLNAAKVPQLFGGTGAAKIGDDAKAHPWTMGYLPSFRAEGAIYGRSIARVADAKVAVLYEDSDFGKDMTSGLKKGLGAKASSIVAAQAYEPTDTSIDSQMSSLHASGANVLVLNVTPQYAILAYLAAHKFGWHPKIYVSSVCISPNVMDIVRASVGDAGERLALDRVRQGPDRQGLGEGPGRRSSTGRSSRSTRPARSRRTSTTSTAWASRSRWSTRSSAPARARRAPRCCRRRRT